MDDIRCDQAVERQRARSIVPPRTLAQAAGAAVAVALAAWSLPALSSEDAVAGGRRTAHAIAAQAQVIVRWGSPEGLRRLERTRHKASFAALANHFEPQQNKLFCGPATATVVLNALRLEASSIAKPEDPRLIDAAGAAYLPPNYNAVFSRYTQDTFFTAQTDSVKTRLQVYGEPKPGAATRDYGLQLRQLDGMLQVHGLYTTMRIVDDAMLASRVREELSSALLDPRRFVIVNYYRPALGQRGRGHISPVGAYDPDSDSFLVMDVNPNAGPWAWVPTDALVAAMRTPDVVENRGYIIIREGLGSSSSR